MENNKIKKEINDIVNDNLKALEQLFPSAVKDGQLDIKALKEELGDFEEVTTEKYELNWSGKQNAKKMVQQGIGNKTLKFVEKDSKNADTTENIYIEGDNLEVLKLLRQNYYNSIKMIYIDMFFSKMIQEPILYSLQSNLNKGFKKNQNRIKQSLF